MYLYVIDFETYYSRDYSLSKITTEAYVNHPEFEVILMGVQYPDGRREYISGSFDEYQRWFNSIDWSDKAILCHNTLFDGAIMAWRFGVKPKLWLDSYCMARAMFGAGKGSLATLATHYNMPEKGTYVTAALGKHRKDFLPHELALYGEYCLNDVDITFSVFELMAMGWYGLEDMDLRHPFPKSEIRLIDRIFRMYFEPKLTLNKGYLENYLLTIIDSKKKLLANANTSKEILQSNEKFAEALRNLGVTPPKKISTTTHKETYAFAKTDKGLNELLDHPDLRVQTLVSARLGVKSTLEETRAERLIDIAGRNSCLPVPLQYSAARTHRLGGTDKINLQNLPSRGKNKNRIKQSIGAPPGYVLINADSSNIEARGVAWLAGQDDLLDSFRNNRDVYAEMATVIYGREITKAKDPVERFVGKTVILGCGYGTGAKKLQATLESAETPVVLSEQQAVTIIGAYRNKYNKIQTLWRRGDKALKNIVDNREGEFGEHEAVRVDGKRGILLPNGLYISYPQLGENVRTQSHPQYAGGNSTTIMYKDVREWVQIHGAKLTENVVQALAGIIVKEQMMLIQQKYDVVLTVHDSVVCIAKESEVQEAVQYVAKCMRTVPAWAANWPLDCEVDVGYNYGDMEPWTI